MLPYKIVDGPMWFFPYMVTVMTTFNWDYWQSSKPAIVYKG